MKDHFASKNFSVHTEIRHLIGRENGKKGSYIFDIVVIDNRNRNEWLKKAVKCQDSLKKGNIEARFSSVPIEYFKVVIEVKIQSNVGNAKNDISKLCNIKSEVALKGFECDCYFVLLNSRGKKEDHKKIREYAKNKNITCVESGSKLSDGCHKYIEKLNSSQILNTYLELKEKFINKGKNTKNMGESRKRRLGYIIDYCGGKEIPFQDIVNHKLLFEKIFNGESPVERIDGTNSHNYIVYTIFMGTFGSEPFLVEDLENKCLRVLQRPM